MSAAAPLSEAERSSLQRLTSVTCQGRGQSIMFAGGGLEPRVWRAREREPITRVWGRSPQGGPGAEPLVRGAKPPEAEIFLASGCVTEAANLPHSVGTLTLSRPK